MATMIDPRPVEPSWVLERDTPGLFSVFIDKTYWHKESRCFMVDSNHHEVTSIELLQQVQELLDKGNWYHEITIHIEACPTLEYSDLTRSINFPTGYIGLHWRLFSGNRENEEDSGTCPDELLSCLAWAILDNEKGSKFILELSEDDPTP